MILTSYFTRALDQYKLYRHVYPFIWKNIYREIKPENTIVFFSFPRSGSTWFSELLLSIPSCLIDEPLQRGLIKSPNILPDQTVKRLKEVAEQHFYFFQPIPREETDPQLKKMIEKLIGGRALSIALYDDYGLSRLKNASTFIVKFNYGCLLSSWVTQSFPVSAIFLVRNPYSCLASILRHELSQKLEIPEKCKVPAFRFNEVYTKYEHIYSRIKTREEYFTFLWCINYKEGVKQNVISNKNLLVYYEDFLLDFDKKIEKVFKYLKKPIPENIYELNRKPSLSAAIYAVKNIDEGTQLTAWKKELSTSQTDLITGILDAFEINIYKDKLLPGS